MMTSKLDLVGQQVHEGPFILLAHGFAAVAKEVVASSPRRFTASTTVTMVSSRATSEQAPRQIEIEGRGDGKRLGDAGGFDQQIVEPVFGGQAPSSSSRSSRQRAAVASVRHLDEGLVGAAQLAELYPRAPDRRRC